MWAERLLIISSWVCGGDARRAVFEPLIADWQREWLSARRRRDRGRALLSGGLAFGISMALGINTRDVVQRHAIGIGWLALPTFSVIGGWLLYLYALPWILLTWSSRSDGMPYPFEYLSWHVPAVMTYGLLFAVLPVALTLAAGGMRVRGLAAALSMALVAYVAIDGWWSPQWRESNLRHYHGDRAIAGNYRVQTSNALVLNALSADPRVALPARAALLPRLTMPVSVLGLGLVGAAVGRRRRLTRSPIGLRTIVGAWVGAWLIASLLGRAVGYQGMYRPPAAPDATMWLPPLVMLAVGLTASIVIARAQRAASPPARTP
jgi:hypothetical protein